MKGRALQPALAFLRDLPVTVVNPLYFVDARFGFIRSGYFSAK